ncbi:iron uptake system protein EfeO [Ornithinicoccus hortensis]|uniref:Iron uptake system component EfeO n=1 Tax=Ornithinicoccus hortensis TaxID=82346 RepID=A0A542YUT4_9MICO|nr:iron uptake system protein EfeO [Ornithinicoccus hortensis]TQL51724.1 iron uptake system component EfeO [Ornithinicoccus hortensis]
MRRVLPTVLVGALAITVAGCQSNSPEESTESGEAGGPLSVVSTDDQCEVSTTEAPSGRIAFSVKNEGSQVTEFYLLGDDGLRIIGEVENIGPGLTRDLVLQAAPGDYFTACKPGMVGEGIRAAFTVSDSGADLVAGEDAELVEQANVQYGSYVKDQTEQLLTETQEFAELYTAGDDDAARALYPEARVHWERIETVAEAFGDLDPRMDLREADLEPDQEWTGWHAIEKDLWPPVDGSYEAKTDEERTALADQLVADTQELYDRTRDQDYTADQIGNGAKGLLDEVATGKVTGEEEYWSHTDLWDFQANVDGARVGWEGLRPLLQQKDPELDAEVETRFEELQALLDEQRDGEGFVLYTDLSTEEVKALSDAVNALSEPLSQVTAAVLS